MAWNQCSTHAGEEDWQPLLRPEFLETVWQKLVGLWQELGFQPAEGSANPSPAVAQYVQSGVYPQSDNTYIGRFWQDVQFYNRIQLLVASYSVQTACMFTG